MPRQINGRMMGKQAPVIKRLQQQREQRLQNEMSKQRERAKAQREQHRARARKTEETKKQQDAEREHKTKEKKDKAEKVKRQREREQEKKREKERQEAEKREQKQARFDEKKHLKDLSSDNKLLADDLTVRSVKPLTFPKEFRFATDSRSRKCPCCNKENHVENVPAPTKTTSAVARVRSTAAATNKRTGRGTTGSRHGRTKPVGFVFSTEARASRKRPEVHEGKRRRLEAAGSEQQ